MWRAVTDVAWGGMSSATAVFRAAANGVDQLEPLDAVVVVGLGFDVHFFETRDGAVAGRLRDVHLRRAILEHANEVFGVAFARQSVTVGERDAVRRVRHHASASPTSRVGSSLVERQRVAAGQRQPAGRGRTGRCGRGRARPVPAGA